MENAIVVKKAHYTRSRRAQAWLVEQQAKREMKRIRNMRASLKAEKAAARHILPQQSPLFNPIRGLVKVAA
jgi:hypothetical protein